MDGRRRRRAGQRLGQLRQALPAGGGTAHLVGQVGLAETHLHLGNVDAAVETAHVAVDGMGGVTSARGTNALEDLRKKLARRRGVPAVAEFLEYTATT
ncbi:hypothetical protein [Streptomyces albidoflavus]|uniref:hypothetical protein n=1 Tax=Streptomyces albidoflavus TaxID=1886 RepID=UPI00188CDDDF|nr:hypothetical protein [Streptomyces albidoflavus]MBF4138177.1 hypothetical protein [Streptomyces albidoflavus]